MLISNKKNSGWDSKVNFVDVNNVLVGYDMSQSCCENADWFISETEDDDVPESGRGITGKLEDYVFDVNYFQEAKPKRSDRGHSVFDKGGMVRFKLVATGKPDLYLHLYNIHNGYYGHGFDASIGGLKWQEGCL